MAGTSSVGICLLTASLLLNLLPLLEAIDIEDGYDDCSSTLGDCIEACLGDDDERDYGKSVKKRVFNHQ